MPTDPAKVAEFTRRHLESLDDLQVLILCVDDRDRWWSPDTVASRLGITAGVARRALDRFVKANLFDIRISDDMRYRFAPGTPALDADAAAWLAEYRKNPLSVVTELTGRHSVRDFADAFRLKRHDDR